MATFGKINEFVPGGNWENYCERLEQYYLANNIDNEDRKRAILLASCGENTYTLMKNLCSPQKPSEKSFGELTKKLQDHLSPKPLTIAERFKFYLRRQQENETVRDFIAVLRKLAETCDFGEFLDFALRDIFVCGLKSKNRNIQKVLLTKKDLTVHKAVEIAVSMEAAEIETSAFPTSSGTVNKVKGDTKECWRCGKVNHTPENCFYKGVECHRCLERGHLGRRCTKSRQRSRRDQDPGARKAENYTKPYSSSGRKFDRKKKKQVKVKYVGDSDSGTGTEFDELSEVSSDSDAGVYTVKTVSTKKSYPEIMVPVNVSGVQMKMELDTGSCVSIVSERMYDKLLSHIPLKRSIIKLSSYTNDAVEVSGKVYVTVECNGQVKKLPLYVVKGKGPALFGRNWMKYIKLDWAQIHVVSMDKPTNVNAIDSLLSKYKTVFADKLGTVKGVQATLTVKEGATPKFYKPRPVPYALKDKIGTELKRLEDSGVVEKVTYSDYATPIVPIMKPDGSVRICGDYKITINPLLDVPEHPMPKPAELFAQLNGGQRFTKLDMSQAYAQLMLDENSRKYVTINTHLGLFRYRRLPYGISAAPAIFQATMDKILAGIKVGCFLDDIIVTGSNDAEHLYNLEALFKRLDAYGISLKRSKCEFMKTSLKFLGHVIDAEGLHPAPDTGSAVLDAPTPTNVKELQSFNGLVNYYRAYLPNLSTEMGPLNRLLGKGVPWDWNKECNKAFKRLKKMLTSSDVLVHYDPNKAITLAVDASPCGVGAVISHDAQGQDRPIAYASRSLTKAETGYSQIEKESLAIIYGVQKFHQYLYGRHFVLLTDHKALTYILGPKKGIPILAASRLQRWAIQLAAYTFDIKYRTSKQNANVDALSRLPLSDASTEMKSVFSIGTEQETTDVISRQVNSLPITASKIARATRPSTSHS